MGAVTLGYTGYLHALDYARTRVQGGPDGSGSDVGADSPDRPCGRAADAARPEGLCRGRHGLILACAALVDEMVSTSDDAARERARQLLDVLTPIAKSWPSQWCLVANDLAIQVHGGYGYTREYNVEQFYRDNRLNPIHEGTHGIQDSICWGAR